MTSWSGQNPVAGRGGAEIIRTLMGTSQSLLDNLLLLLSEQSLTPGASGECSEEFKAFYTTLVHRSAELDIECPLVWLSDFDVAFKNRHPGLVDDHDLINKVLDCAAMNKQCQRAVRLLTGFTLSAPESGVAQRFIQQLLLLKKGGWKCIALLKSLANKPGVAEQQVASIRSGPGSAGRCLVALTLLGLLGNASAEFYALDKDCSTGVGLVKPCRQPLESWK